VLLIHAIGSMADVLAIGGSLIQKIGSYAGFAAVVGLGVLAALYFSQARDVKRLREWAGRAPERAVEAEAAGRPVTAEVTRAAQPANVQRIPTPQPSQPQGAAAQQAAGAQNAAAAAGAQQAAAGGQQTAAQSDQQSQSPAAQPAAAAAGKASTPAGAAASAAGAGAATAPAGAAASPAAPAQGEKGPATGATPAAKPGSPATTAAKTAPAATPPASSGGGSGNGPGTGAKVLPARQVAPPRPAPTPARTSSPSPSQTAVIPPQRGRTGRRLPERRYLALIVGGLIVLGLGGTVGVLALTGSDKKSSGSTVSLPRGGKQTSSGSKKKSTPSAPAIDPKTVTVAVLNGTNVTGLASRFGQKVKTAGFQLGTVATAAQQQRTESVVLYKPGASRQARAVARKMGVSQIEPIDAATSGLAGTATVVLVVGADKAGQ
jgi:hypothetical protein